MPLIWVVVIIGIFVSVQYGVSLMFFILPLYSLVTFGIRTWNFLVQAILLKMRLEQLSLTGMFASVASMWAFNYQLVNDLRCLSDAVTCIEARRTYIPHERVRRS